MKYASTLLLVTFLLFTELHAQQGRILVSGTRVSMVPPKDFIKGENFTGFQMGENAVINVMDLNGGNFYTNAATFTKSNFESKGITIHKYKELTIDGYPAKMALMEVDILNSSYNVVFGDSTFSVMIMSVFPSGNQKLAEEIEKSILTAKYSKNLTIDPFESTFFSIDDSNSILKFSQSSANMFMYTVGGADKSFGDGPTVMVLPLPNDSAESPKEVCESVVEGLKEKGVGHVEYVSSSDKPINKLKAYELVVKSKMGSKSTNLIIFSVMKGDKQLIIQGFQGGDSFEPDVIRDLVQTVKID